MLERQKIRNQLKEILTGRTQAGNNVTSNRFTTLGAEDLPAINIVIPIEHNTSNTANHIPAFDTILTLNIEISIAATAGWDDLLDTICEEIEDLTLKNLDFINGFAEISSYTTNLSYEAGQTPIATAIMVFELAFNQTFNPIQYTTPFKIAYVNTLVALGMAEAENIKTQFELEQGD